MPGPAVIKRATAPGGSPGDSAAPSDTTELSGARSNVPPAAPLAPRLAQSRAAADAGDAGAACRLAFDLDRCRLVPEHEHLAVRLGADLDANSKAPLPDAERIDALRSNLDSVIAQLAADRAFCAGVGTDSANSAWRYLLRAAQAGDVPSMTRFAVLPPLDEQDTGTDPEGWRAYRENAVPFLETAAQRGDVDALSILAACVSGSCTLPGGVTLPRDPARAATLTLLLLKTGDAPSASGRLKNLMTEIGPGAMDRARAEAEGIYRERAGTLGKFHGVSGGRASSCSG